MGSTLTFVSAAACTPLPSKISDYSITSSALAAACAIEDGRASGKRTTKGLPSSCGRFVTPPSGACMYWEDHDSKKELLHGAFQSCPLASAGSSPLFRCKL